MSRRRHSNRAIEQVELEPAMDSMTDVVFLLLVFFIFTFQVRAFELLVPLETLPNPEAAAAASTDKPLPQVYVTADANGELESVRLDQQTFASLRDFAQGLPINPPESAQALTVWPGGQIKYSVVIEILQIAQQAGWQVKVGSQSKAAP